MTVDRNIQLAWAAGFIDGEGFVGMNRIHNRENGRDYFTTIVDVSQNHARPLQALVDLFGGEVKIRRVHKGVGAGTQHFFWRLHGEKAISALEQVLPYLQVKDRQARILIEFQATMAGYGKKRRITQDAYAYRRGLYQLLVELNSRPPSDAERLSESTPLKLAVVNAAAVVNG
jgi:hypothetical protein